MSPGSFLVSSWDQSQLPAIAWVEMSASSAMCSHCVQCKPRVHLPRGQKTDSRFGSEKSHLPSSLSSPYSLSKGQVSLVRVLPQSPRLTPSEQAPPSISLGNSGSSDLCPGEAGCFNTSKIFLKLLSLRFESLKRRERNGTNTSINIYPVQHKAWKP